MGLPPYYLFVVRHGNRLDAADKQWHLTSPTPYDPPLTYSGFLQARSVGQEIAQILHRDKDEERTATPRTDGEASPAKRRRFKVVIHSSPFLRCVQTSIGISSGLAQRPPGATKDIVDVIEPADHLAEQGSAIKSTLLRLDSFLGEWLTPDYYEMITPPPGAALMLGTAKADLFRRVDYAGKLNFTTHVPARSSGSGSLWNGSPLLNAPPASQLSNTEISTAPTSVMRTKDYVAPRPAYAMATSGPIPDGFVAHAKDECVVVDYQWDSMRKPLAFGDGGVYGEEWPAMHRRFRAGARSLVNWYWNSETPAETISSSSRPSSRHAGVPPRSAATMPPDDDAHEVETVVILVSHGAGCNALIGAITNQPVLMDVGLASLTMATRKRGIKPRSATDAAAAAGLGEEPTQVSTDALYDIRMSASTEHLRGNNYTPITARTHSADERLPTVGRRSRTATLATSTAPNTDMVTYPDSFRPTTSNGRLGLVTRVEGDSHGHYEFRPSKQSALASIGYNSIAENGVSPPSAPPAAITPPRLWSPLIPAAARDKEDATTSERDDLGAMLSKLSTTSDSNGSRAAEQTSAERPLLPVTSLLSGSDFSTANGNRLPPTEMTRGGVFSAPIRLNTKYAKAHDGEKQEHEKTEKEGKKNIPEQVAVTQLGDGLGGLWGRPPSPEEAERLRDTSMMKRRWTMNERA